jgi:excisionase family DNA binding protein
MTAQQPTPPVTRAQLRHLPVVVDLMTAARVLGIGRTKAYELARAGRFPCRILRVGESYRVPTADLLRTVGVDPDTQGDEPAEDTA